MEVLKEAASMLSNYEVFDLLTDIQNGRNGQKKPNKYLSSLATITFSTLKYLEKTPCKEQDPEAVSRFLAELEPFKLTRVEKLQLLNHRPETAVEIQLIVEESEERLTEEQTEQILQLVATHLPGGQNADPNAENTDPNVDQNAENADESADPQHASMDTPEIAPTE